MADSIGVALPGVQVRVANLENVNVDAEPGAPGALMVPGPIVIVDRRKDLIITAGDSVYPAEIERVIAGHPAVAMVAVGPIPAEVKGELACAYVVAREGAS